MTNAYADVIFRIPRGHYAGDKFIAVPTEANRRALAAKIGDTSS